MPLNLVGLWVSVLFYKGERNMAKHLCNPICNNCLLVQNNRINGQKERARRTEERGWSLHLRGTEKEGKYICTWHARVKNINGLKWQKISIPEYLITKQEIEQYLTNCYSQQRVHSKRLLPGTDLGALFGIDLEGFNDRLVEQTKYTPKTKKWIKSLKKANGYKAIEQCQLSWQDLMSQANAKSTIREELDNELLSGVL
jgi:hypothetical protein